MQPDYALISQLLTTTATDLTPAAIHGALSGYICSGGQPPAEILSDLMETELPDVISRLLIELGADAEKKLASVDYVFEPILPADDTALHERMAALGDWCDRFAVGFAAGFMRPQSDLGAEIHEVLIDFTQLAAIAPDEQANSEEDEKDFMELVEYVRMATIAVYQQLQSPEAGQADDELETGMGESLFADPSDDKFLH